MSREEIRQAFEGAGWRMSDRTDEHVLVGDAEDPSLSILAREEVIGAADPAFELVDREHNVTYWVRVVPTPRQAATLLEEHGGLPEEERGNPRRR